MKNLLIVVDYQCDFVDGSLGFPGAETLDGLIAEKIRAYRGRGDTVAFTFDTHGADYLGTQEGKNLPVVHCIKGTGGWSLYGQTGALLEDSDPVFEKPAFGSAGLFDWLRENPFGQIELAGLVLNICVVSNAVLAKTAQPESTVVVDARAVGSADRAMFEKTLDLLESIQVTVVNRS